MKRKLKVLSLFTGAGGLDIGLETAGFKTVLCIENNSDAELTLKHNRPHWKLATPSDIHEIKPNDLLEQAGVTSMELDLLAGGPPCQPFSKSGYWATGDTSRLRDPRADTLAAYLSILEVSLPKVFLLENVKGIAFSKKDEGLVFFKKKLESINEKNSTNYIPHVIHLNAADYGVPQKRERVFIIAHREGLDFSAPCATHGLDLERPHRTTWDAIGDLDEESWATELDSKGKWADLLPSIPEGENYQWHTDRSGGESLFGWRTRYWSFLLKLSKAKPSWTIQASPGPATGPFHWRSRELSTLELARIQTFPDNYKILGNKRVAHRQIGNAVPPAIGELLGLEIRRQFFGEKVRRKLRLIPVRRKNCPPPEKTKNVPAKYLEQRGVHKEHPGTGKGPRALRTEQKR